ncbi:MAG: 4Fe-4S binding protein [Rhodocyclaceae bacterium]|nr:4Fe-4S binding protein [Rhodocyclaceae bacterium]
MTPTDTNRAARTSALSALGSAANLAHVSVGFESAGRTLILGPEHRIRRVAAALGDDMAACGLLTQAMPEHITPEIEAAAELAPDLTLVQAPLRSLTGYLGRFDAQVDIDGKPASLAQLVFKHDACDLVIDLNDAPTLAVELPPAGYLHAGHDDGLDAVAEQARELVGEFDKPRYAHVNNAICAHSANGKTGCTRCLDACPADAIRSVAGRIEIDSHLCHGAGGCATACPTGAIHYDLPEPAVLQSRLEKLLAGYLAAGGATPRLLLHDADAGAAWVARHLDTLDGCWLPLRLEELGAAGLDLWLQALARGASEVVLLDSGVSDTIRRDLQREFALAHPILAALGTGHRVALAEGDALLAGWSPVCARPLPPLSGRAGSQGKRERISAATAHLYRNSGLPVADLAVAMPAGAPFGTLAIRADDCTLCNACVSTCPAKALGSGRDRPLLSFVEDKCVQCGLCVASCPEKVLSLETRYQLDPDIRAGAVTLKEEAPFECIRCGKPFATQSMIRTMQARLTGHHLFSGTAAERLKMCADCRIVDMATHEQDAGLVGLGEAVRSQRSPH